MKKNTLLWLGLGALLFFSFKKKPTKSSSVFIPDTITQTEEEFEADRKTPLPTGETMLAKAIKQATSFIKRDKKIKAVKPKKVFVSKPEIKMPKTINPPIFSFQNFK